MSTRYRTKNFQSICVKDPIIEDQYAHVPPIYATSTFSYEDLEAAFAFFRGENNIATYSRLGNPSTAFVAQKIAELEVCNLDEEVEARGLLFASGMAAISSALLSQLKAGDIVLTQSVLYGTSSDFLQTNMSALGVQVLTNDFKDPEEIRKILRSHPTIKVFYLETPINPTLECIDLKSMCAIAQEYGVKTIVDNTFATSYIQQPFKFGVDIVVYSSTKFMNGHGTGISGAAVTRTVEDHKKLYKILKNFGGICSPFEAYLLNNGLKTLALRIQKHQQNAQTLADYLEQHPLVNKVNFLGLLSHPDFHLAQEQMHGTTGMMSFEIKGGYAAGLAFQKNIKFCTKTASLGTADTLITHSASTSHSNVSEEIRWKYGISPGLIRSSVGIEDIDDVIQDFDQAFSQIE
ncbi:MAG TPA: aminotransferase class I/II-fold pyridoxal phosphate-dependent enzyme [Chitinophagales bacterium]|nr:aminotransferase class I/II-fold pyridoxal phosphate-dependent enzyme [Chitinophagales bacterium]